MKAVEEPVAPFVSAVGHGSEVTSGEGGSVTPLGFASYDNVDLDAKLVSARVSGRFDNAFRKFAGTLRTI